MINNDNISELEVQLVFLLPGNIVFGSHFGTKEITSDFKVYLFYHTPPHMLMLTEQVSLSIYA